MQQITPAPRVRRIELALAENARIDAAIAALEALKTANVASAQRNDSWCLKAQYEAAEAVQRVFEDDDLASVRDSLADILWSECRYSVSEGRTVSRREMEA